MFEGIRISSIDGVTSTNEPTPGKQISFGILEAAPSPKGGVLAKRIDKLSSLGKAGVVDGDEILTLNGVRLTTPDVAMRVLKEVGLGGTVTVSLIRNGQALNVPMKVLEKAAVSLELKSINEAKTRKISPAA